MAVAGTVFGVGGYTFFPRYIWVTREKWEPLTGFWQQQTNLVIALVGTITQGVCTEGTDLSTDTVQLVSMVTFKINLGFFFGLVCFLRHWLQLSFYSKVKLLHFWFVLHFFKFYYH